MHNEMRICSSFFCLSFSSILFTVLRRDSSPSLRRRRLASVDPSCSPSLLSLVCERWWLVEVAAFYIDVISGEAWRRLRVFVHWKWLATRSYVLGKTLQTAWERRPSRWGCARHLEAKMLEFYYRSSVSRLSRTSRLSFPSVLLFHRRRFPSPKCFCRLQLSS